MWPFTRKSYRGLCLYTLSGRWHISVFRGRGESKEVVRPRELFTARMLSDQLFAEGIPVTHVRLEDTACVVKTTTKSGNVAPEGRRIKRALKRCYPKARGQRIRWKWDIRKFK